MKKIKQSWMIDTGGGNPPSTEGLEKISLKRMTCEQRSEWKWRASLEGPQGFQKGPEAGRRLLYSRTGWKANMYCFGVNQEEDLKWNERQRWGRLVILCGLILIRGSGKVLGRGMSLCGWWYRGILASLGMEWRVQGGSWSLTTGPRVMIWVIWVVAVDTEISGWTGFTDEQIRDRQEK